MPFLKFWGYSFKYDVQIPKSKLLLFLEAPHYLRFGSAVLNAGAQMMTGLPSSQIISDNMAQWALPHLGVPQ